VCCEGEHIHVKITNHQKPLVLRLLKEIIFCNYEKKTMNNNNNNNNNNIDNNNNSSK
jgi:hypothetical protein